MSCKPFDVVLVITELEIGGAETALVELATRADHSRFAVTVVSLSPPPKNTTLTQRLEVAGVPTFFLGITSVWRVVSVVRGWLKLCQILREQHPTVVHSFLFHANIVARLAAWWYGVPQHFSGLRVAERGKRWHCWIDRATQRLVSRYVCVSDEVATFAQDTLSISADKCVVIPNGIDTALYHTASQKTARNVAIVIGRLHYQKGIDWLLDLAPIWLDVLPTWDLLIVGDGEERATLEHQITEPNFDDVRSRIRFLGWRDDVPSLLAASSLLILTSRWEGMPNVVLQAMAAGKPVLASRVEGIRALLGDGDEANDQTFPPGDDDAFLAALARLTREPDLATALGDFNRRRAEEHFTIDCVVVQYEKLWEDK